MDTVHLEKDTWAYQRGDLLVALTNTNDDKTFTPSLTNNYGEEICNIFDANDCLDAANGELTITLKNMETKMYLPKSSTFWAENTVVKEKDVKFMQA